MNLHKCATYMLLLLMAAGPSNAEDAEALLQDDTLSFSRLMTNDYIGDRNDRWRTFAYSASALKPLDNGGVAELRFRAEIIAGRRLKLASHETPDRRMVGTLGLGIYHSKRINIGDYRAGVELTLIGPQTGLVKLQQRTHEFLSQNGPSAHAQELQVPDDVLLSFNGEFGRDIEIGGAVVRPWAAAVHGPESLARFGIDFIWGHAAANFGVRDEVTGWRIPVRQSRNASGRSLMAGFDISHVESSPYIDQDQLMQNRLRARAGALIDFEGSRIFYGTTYLSEEFTKQSEPQVVGSVTLSLSF